MESKLVIFFDNDLKIKFQIFRYFCYSWDGWIVYAHVNNATRRLASDERMLWSEKNKEESWIECDIFRRWSLWNKFFCVDLICVYKKYWSTLDVDFNIVLWFFCSDNDSSLDLSNLVRLKKCIEVDSTCFF